MSIFFLTGRTALHSSGMVRSLLSSRDTRRHCLGGAMKSSRKTPQHDTVRIFQLYLSIVVFRLFRAHLLLPFPYGTCLQHQAVVYLKASIDYHEPTRMAAHAILGVWETELVGWDSFLFWGKEGRLVYG